MRYLVWGGGGHGKVVADLIRANGDEVLGFIDADREKLHNVVEPGNARVVILEGNFRHILQENGQLPLEADALAIAIGNNRVRLDRLEEARGVRIPPIVHPSAVISPSARIGEGTVVLPGAIVNAAAFIGRGVIVSTSAVVEHDCVVGDGAHLSPAAILGGGARVGPCAWVGAGAVVIQLVGVGSDAIVGAGGVVLRDVPDRTTVAGVPAKRISIN